MMLPPWSGVLDWSTFAVRMEPTAANLKNLKAHLKTLDHAKMLRGVRQAKHALTYAPCSRTSQMCMYMPHVHVCIPICE